MTLKNIKLLYESQENLIKLLNDYSQIVSETKHKGKHGEGLKILNPKKLLQKLPTEFPKVKRYRTI